ncbi:hypothetical protein M076_2118 [Bacteroides fragilis str. 2-F-2 |uniref:Uncharacterized protein n=1 Tax=Bacteroides fragilis str. 2-F-2 \|nr:hypothetical protein M076_2118 [Bacteroides fragilis str. 2-F-2 \
MEAKVQLPHEANRLKAIIRYSDKIRKLLESRKNGTRKNC